MDNPHIFGTRQDLKWPSVMPCLTNAQLAQDAKKNDPNESRPFCRMANGFPLLGKVLTISADWCVQNFLDHPVQCFFCICKMNISLDVEMWSASYFWGILNTASHVVTFTWPQLCTTFDLRRASWDGLKHVPATPLSIQHPRLCDTYGVQDGQHAGSPTSSLVSGTESLVSQSLGGFCWNIPFPSVWKTSSWFIH